jgi:hypothetical protein
MEEFRRLTRLQAYANFYAALRSTVFSDDYLGQIAALVQTGIDVGRIWQSDALFLRR